MTEVSNKDDIFALPESSYDVAKLTDYYAKATEGSQRILQKEKRCYVMYLRKSTNDEAKQVRSLEQQQQIVTAKEATLTQAETELERVSRALPTEQQFVELTRSYLKTLLKTKDLVEEDLVYREVVLNLHANNDFVSVIKLNPPYNLMVDLEKVPYGRGDRT